MKRQKKGAVNVSTAPLFFIGTCAQDNVDMSTCMSIQALRLSGHNFVWVIQGVGGNTRTKNILMTQFVKQIWGASPYLIFIDRDIVFDPQHVDMLLEDMQAGYDFVGGAYPLKDASQIASHNPEGIDFDGTVKTILWQATGFSGVTRKLLQKMIKQLDLPLLHKGEDMEFYIDNREYLYDNPKYNQFQHYQVERLFPAVHTWGQRTLDIGCGIGSLVFILAGQDNESWGWDINPVIVDFCNFKNHKYGLDAHFTTKKPYWGDFDLVSALGTFEHFEHLEEFIAELGGGMKRGAKLYHYDDFYDQTISPMHFDFSKEMPHWLEDAGFIEYDERWAVKA